MKNRFLLGTLSFLIGTSALAASGNASLPTSSSADNTVVSERIQGVVKQVNSDLTKIKVNTGDLSVPETDQSELEAAMKNAAERRRLQSLTALTQGAGSLAKAQEGVAKTQESILEISKKAGSLGGGAGGSDYTGGSSVSNTSGLSLVQRKKDLLDAAIRKANAEEDERKAHLENIRIIQERRQADRKTMHDRLMKRVREVAGASHPIVSSIYGPSFAPQANLLIPYMGEKSVTAGDRVKLIDNSEMTILAIDGKGVLASSKGERFRLGSGDSVPGREALVSVIQSVQDEMTKAGDFNDLDLKSGNITGDEEVSFGVGHGHANQGDEALASDKRASNNVNGVSFQTDQQQSRPPAISIPHIQKQIDEMKSDEADEQGGGFQMNNSGRSIPVHFEKNGEEAPPISQ